MALSPQLLPVAPSDNILHNPVHCQNKEIDFGTKLLTQNQTLFGSHQFLCAIIVLFCFPVHISMKSYHMDGFWNHQDMERFQSPQRTPVY